MQQTLSLYILYFVAKKKTKLDMLPEIWWSDQICFFVHGIRNGLEWNILWSTSLFKKKKTTKIKKKLAIVKWNNFTAEDVKTNSCRWWCNRIWGRWADALRALTTKQTCKKFSISCRERKRERKIEMIIVVLSALIILEMVYISKGIC